MAHDTSKYSKCILFFLQYRCSACSHLMGLRDRHGNIYYLGLPRNKQYKCETKTLAQLTTSI